MRQTKTSGSKKRREKCFIKVIAYAYLDEHEDATLFMDDVDRKYYRAELEEHDDVVGELGEFYLMDVAPQDGKGNTTAIFYSMLLETYILGKYNNCKT